MEGHPELIDYLLRIAGRIGFCILLLTLYRVYSLFASPLVKKKHKKFIIMFSISVVVSFILMALNYVIPADWLSTASLAFNVLTTYVFAVYLYYQGNVLESYKDSKEFTTLSSAMDALILKLKYS